MKNPTKSIKQRIAKFLHQATSVVLRSYERYLSSDLPEDLNDEPKQPSEFKKFHDAGKSAASHLESLLKLAHATDDSEEQQKKSEEKERKENLQGLMKRADMED